MIDFTPLGIPIGIGIGCVIGFLLNLILWIFIPFWPWVMIAPVVLSVIFISILMRQ